MALVAYAREGTAKIVVIAALNKCFLFIMVNAPLVGKILYVLLFLCKYIHLYIQQVLVTNPTLSIFCGLFLIVVNKPIFIFIKLTTENRLVFMIFII